MNQQDVYSEEGLPVHLSKNFRTGMQAAVAAIVIALPISLMAGMATANTASLIQNPSAETLTAPNQPTGWTDDYWGTNDAKLTVSSDAHSGSNALRVETSYCTSGDAKWMSAAVTVDPAVTYSLSYWYKSNVATEVDVLEGGTKWRWLADLPAASVYTQKTLSYKPSVGMTQVSFMDILPCAAGARWLMSDDYALTGPSGGTTTSPPPSTTPPVPPSVGPMLSIVFDDNTSGQYKNGRPVMLANKLKGTYCVVTSDFNNTPDYMTVTQIKQLATDGNEICNHTVHHPAGGLAGLSRSTIDAEFSGAESAIQSKIGVTPTTCAYPEGTYDQNVLDSAAAFRFRGCRSVDVGNNCSGSISRYKLMDVNIDINTTLTQVKSEIDKAYANGCWIILTYHEIGTYSPGGQWRTTTSQFTSEMAYVASKGIRVVTMNQGLAALGY